MIWKVRDIVKICNGKLYCGDENVTCQKFSNDTRTINNGDIYIGIKGDQFDGNSFYQDAFEKGAGACILEKSYESEIKVTDKPIIIVKDSIEALKNLAMAKLEIYKPKVIAVTGSVGKTSTRDMIYSIISKKYKTLIPEKNYNNHIGLPLTILKLQDEEIILLEMGMNHLGEIEYLSNIAKPDVAVITNILPVHIENLGSMENILKAKLEITSGLKKDGILIINNDDEYLHNAKIDFSNIITCGIKNNSTFKALDINDTDFEVNIKNKNFQFVNSIGTNGYLLNCLIAIAVGVHFDIQVKDIEEALRECKLTSGRLEKLHSNKGALIINDSYNANATSMINSLEYLKKEKGERKIAILGDINELGDYAKEEHSKVGKYLAENSIDYLITIGNNAKYISDEASKCMKNIKYFETKEEAKEFIKQLIKPTDAIVIKASNSCKFIELVNFIKENC